MCSAAWKMSGVRRHPVDARPAASQIHHLFEKAGMAPEEVLVLGVDLQDDGLA